MPKCELCNLFDPPKPGVGSVGWCRKFQVPCMISDSCNDGELKESGVR